ncbi:Signal peptidase complex catalytic subunit S11A [Ilyodon furcidens]|uniref:Signal peptidase complex catalytic subunit SEC11 n=1 Tax=Ilyodon furcidens TaxID=33524 RepID=A0ABV0SXV0_9TELE
MFGKPLALNSRIPKRHLDTALIGGRDFRLRGPGSFGYKFHCCSLHPYARCFKRINVILTVFYSVVLATMLSLDFLDDVRRMNKRQLYYQVLNFGMIVSSALMIWKGLMVVTGSESPIVVVLSGSMEPAFHRGDLLFLTNRVEDPIRVGEIVVFRIEGREIPIVHRVLKIHEKENGDIKFLTKGDNNAVDDRGLYKQGQHWLEKKDVVGRARGFVPYIGIVTILMNDYPKFKYAVLFMLGLFVLVHRE